MTKKIFSLIFTAFGIIALLSCQTKLAAQTSEEIFTIYLVRHSEKDLNAINQSDPPLTLCGEKRAESLSNFLSDVKLDVIYSTDFIRTKGTALPTAKSKEMETEIYDSQKLSDFANLLLKNKQNALVVGHSNTTAVLAGLLVNEELEEINLDCYDRIYKVVIYQDARRLQILHSDFVCHD